MAKVIPNVPDENGQITRIDILKYEVDNNLPYWLHPSQKFSHLHDDERRAAYAKYNAEQKAKRHADETAKGRKPK
jgi:hypothetical protein